MNSDMNLQLDFFDNLDEGVYYVDSHRNILFWNKSAAAITGYSKDEVIGVGCREGILTHVDEAGKNMCKSNCPLSAALADNKTHEIEAYLHHKDGHRLPVLIRSVPLRNSENHTIGAIEIFSDKSYKAENLTKMQELAKVAFLDSLTGLSNQNHLKLKLSSTHAEMQKIQGTYGVLIIKINNLFEHLKQDERVVEDRAIKVVAKTITAISRPNYSFGRWEESIFMIIIPNGNKELYQILATKFKNIIEKTDLSIGKTVVHNKVSVQALNPEETEDIEDFLRRIKRSIYSQ